MTADELIAASGRLFDAMPRASDLVWVADGGGLRPHRLFLDATDEEIAAIGASGVAGRLAADHLRGAIDIRGVHERMGP